MRNASWAVNWPGELPRWTVPAVLLATLALEGWQVWHDTRAKEPGLDVWECASVCEAQSGRMVRWAGNACECGVTP